MQRLKRYRTQRKLLVTMAMILAIVMNFLPQALPGVDIPTAEAHNLNASVVYVFFDPDTQAYLDGLIATNQRPVGTPLLQVGDELGLIIKAVPDLGTETGVGGYTTFYVPNGLQVVDAAFLQPSDVAADGITGWDKIPAKGQAQMPAVGAGGEPTVSLVGITRGPNILGVTSPIVTAGNTNLGTLPGVYGDTGIFYSTAPETAFGTYSGGALTNNSGDTVGVRTILGTTLNKWDAWQMAGYGIKGTTNPGYPAAAIIDSNQRGYAPWGLANVVAGPQSGYAWEFDLEVYKTCTGGSTAPNASCINTATQAIGPWQRIKYPGSQFSDDPPGANPPVQPYTRGADASNSGFDLTTGDLPATTGQSNGTPNAVRFAYGQLTYNVPEYSWIKVRVHDTAAILDATGCPKWTVDTFGGDAGGESGGKDHIWRYYDPNSVTFNGCLAVGKPATRELVKVGDNYQYKIKLYNMGANDFSIVQIKDTLPSGVTYISAVPAPSSVSLPYLTWNVSPFLRSQMFEATVTVSAKSTGLLTNTVCATGTTTPGGQTISSCGSDTTLSGNLPLLSQTKSVNPTSAAPGDSVTYQIRITNIGTGPTGAPVTITDYLPAGFTYSGAVPGTLPATLNGASVTVAVSGTAARPVMTVAQAIAAGGELVISLPALVGAATTAGRYCNYYTTNQGGVNLSTGTLACVDVSRASIGDTVYRDWNGDGDQDAGEEGIPGIQVCATPTGGGAPVCATTDANGNYLIAGLQAGTYNVDVTNPPAGYTPTQGAHPTAVTLAQGDNRTDVDFGYRPGGAGSIGDKVFEDIANNGVFDGSDVGIGGVTLTLYEDTNGNGVIDAGQDIQIATTTTNGSGDYSFSNLDPTRSYIVVATDGAGSAVDTYFANPYSSSTGNPQAVSPADFTAQGNAVTDADFGYFGQTPGSIGDTVCVDMDSDKLCTAADQGIAGVDVLLYFDADGDGEPDPSELVSTVATDPSGQYTFDGLGPGAYIVVVDTTDPQIPAGYLPSLSTEIAVTLAVAQNRTDVDFPFARALTKAVDKANANAGDTLNYTITANYPSAVLLQNVSVTDTVPTGTTFVSAGQGGTQSGGVITWNLGSNTDDKPATTAPPGTALCYASTTLTAVEDTYIDKKDPTDWFGSATTMRTRPANTNDIRHSLLRFDVSGIPASVQIVNADLTMTVKSARNNHVDEVHRLNTVWTEGASNVNGATWNDPNGTGTAGVWAAGAFSANDYNATVVGKITPSTNGAKTVSIIPAVTDWVKNGVPNRGLVLLATGTDTGDVEYYTSEEGTASRRPTLTVGYYYESATSCSGTTALTAVADTYVQEDRQTEIKGTVTTMLTNPSNNGAGNAENHSLVKFDLTAIPPGATITSATFDVYVLSNRSNHVDEIHRMKTIWNESASWSDADGAGTGDWSTGLFSSSDYDATSLGTITPNSKNVHRTATITSLVDDWVNNGVANNGVVLKSTGTDTGDASYATRQHATVANRPVLTVVWSQAVSTLPQTTLELHAEPLFLGGSGQIKVTMTASSGGTVTGVTPPASLTIDAFGGASAVLNSGPTPAGPVDISPGSPASFVYIYDVTPGSLPGTLSFTGRPAPTNNFGTATSEGVIVSPALTFQVTVNDPATVGVVENVANISARGADTKLGPDLCYVVADNAPDTTTADQLVSIDPITGDFVDIGATGTLNMEAATWNLTGSTLYGVAAGQLVTIDKDTGASTVVGTIGTIAGALGNITTPDVDGLSFDPSDGKLYAVARREDGNNNNTFLDVLFQINPTTGARVANAYGAGVDYIAIATNTLTPALYDVDDIAFDDAGVLYAVANDATTNMGLSDRLVTLDKATGAVTDIAGFLDAADGVTAVTDVEGLSFLAGVGLIASTGDASSTSAQRNTVWTVDADTAEMTAIVAVPAYSYTDYEAVACVPAPVEPGSLILPPTPSNEVLTALGASIGDRVWADLDGDGVQDANEPGLVGVQVCATPTVGAPICAVTDSLGDYTIGGLTADTYTVAYTPATVPVGYAPSTPASLSVPLSNGQQYKDADFGLQPPGTGSIGDTVWLDADSDGVLDASENGLPTITVRLYIDQNNDGVVDGGDTLLQTTTTDADGAYLFSGLNPDDYLVQVDTASAVTSPYDGTTTIAAAMAPTTGTTNPRDVTISTPGQAVLTADFGYNWSGSIGDTVWFDDNLDQDVDVGEARIPDAVVLLYFDADNDGVIDPSEYAVPVDVVMTDANGNYLFDNLPPGNYLVDVYEDSITVDGNRDIVPTTPDVRDVDLNPGQDVLTADFGYYIGAKVEGNVFWDENHNGVLDAGEQDAAHLLENVTVTIVCLGPDGVIGGGDDYTGSMDTGTLGQPDGHFKFLVPPGPCTLTYDQGDIPAVYGDRTTPTSYTFIAEPGEDWHPTFDFGVDNSGRIGDRVWNDADGDGVQDAAEPGISGVTVRLYDNTLTTLLNTTVTDMFGVYQFFGLADGSYKVVVNPATLPTPPVGTTWEQTGDPDETGTCVTCDDTGAGAVTGGGSDLTVDFGYRLETGGGAGAGDNTISGLIWEDTNGDGVPDVGNPLANVLVTVDCGANGEYVTLSTGTVVLGSNWAVTGIPDGAVCTVTVDTDTLPSPAFVQTGDPDQPGVPCTTCDNQTVVNVLPAGGDVTGVNFGYQQDMGSISGTVCDGDGDGQCDDPGDTPLQGVTVDLRCVGADGFLGTADDLVQTDQTDANGDYSFTNLPPGLCQITQTNLPNYNSLADADGGNPDNISLVLGLGEDRFNQDFEDTPIGNGVIGDFAWIDTDGDSVYDAGTELPLNSVIIEVRNSSGALVATVETGPAGGFPPGAYLVENLPPDTYTVTAVAWPTGFSASGVNPQTVVLDPGETDLTVDFPFNSTTSVVAASFTAQERNRQMTLRWETVIEQGNTGFYVQRAAALEGPYEPLTAQPVPSQSVGGAGASYRWVDATAQPGAAYWYQLVTAPDGVVIGPVAAEQVGTHIYLPVLLRGR